MDEAKEKQEQLTESITEESEERNESLRLFKTNNPSLSILHIDNKIIINNCWSDPSLKMVFDEDEDVSFLSSIQLYDELWAIYHNDQNIFEFIYYPLEQPVDRSFEMHFVGKKFNMYYDKPSAVFNKIVKSLVSTKKLTY